MFCLQIAMIMLIMMIMLIILFSLSRIQNYVSVVTLSAKDNQKLSKLLRKGFEIPVYWNECKTKSENKNTNEYSWSQLSNFVFQ